MWLIGLASDSHMFTLQQSPSQNLTLCGTEIDALQPTNTVKFILISWMCFFKTHNNTNQKLLPSIIRTLHLYNTNFFLFLEIKKKTGLEHLDDVGLMICKYV